MPETADLRLRWTKGGDERTERRKNRRLEIPPCVLQDISPLGPLPKKKEEKIPHMCESIGHQPLWGWCPKGNCFEDPLKHFRLFLIA